MIADFLTSEPQIYFVITIVLLILILLWWTVPKQQAKYLDSIKCLSIDKKVEMENNYRATLTSALGTILLVFSAILAYLQWKGTLGSTNAQLQETIRKNDSDYENVLLMKALDLLGEKDGASSSASRQRLAGIDLLKIYADSEKAPSRKRHDVLIDSMMGLVRDQTQFSVSTEICREFRSNHIDGVTVKPDVQAAIKVLVEESMISPIRLDFRAVNLARADFSGGHFPQSNFAFSILPDSRFEDTDLTDANFFCADLYLAHLKGSHFRSTHPSIDANATNVREVLFLHADVVDADFHNADLRESTLSNSNFRGSHFEGARMDRVNLYKTELTGVHIDDHTDLHQACLIETQLDVNLEKAKNYDTAYVSKSAEDLPKDHFCRFISKYK